jgi:ubiquinol-cytochrome c reductase iron-sulfur subunit
VSSFQPSEKAKAAGAAVGGYLRPQAGEKLTVEWRGKPVWIIKRTPEQLKDCQASMANWPTPIGAIPKSSRRPMRKRSALHQARNPGGRGHLHPPGLLALRQVRPGPAFAARDWKGGFLCPCHGSTFDMAGRVFKNKPAPDNLEVPPHMYLSDTKLLIGEDKKA